jgi:hypothetical protein
MDYSARARVSTPLGTIRGAKAQDGLGAGHPLALAEKRRECLSILPLGGMSVARPAGRALASTGRPILDKTRL